MPVTGPSFNKSVFINCPFDDDYRQMMRAMVFTIMYLGFNQRIATEDQDTGHERISKIKRLIRSTCYSIHDLSRMEPLRKKDLPRFNMPFELGLDLGCREYGSGRLKNKKYLVFEKEKYRYQKVLSDISGNDIEAHDNDPLTLVHKLRGWISNILTKKIPGGTLIWQDFNVFLSHLEQAGVKVGLSKEEIQKMKIGEYMIYIRDWIQEKGMC